MEIKKLQSGEVSEFICLLNIFKIVFENEKQINSYEHLEIALSNSNFMVFVINVNNSIIGGATIYILPSYFGIKPIAYIYDLGISPAFQGRGYGQALLKDVCRYCKENGFEDAYVEAESDDIDAVNFYRKTNAFDEVNAIQFIYKFNEEK